MITDELKALEALARAYDHEEAACMGEPSPWVSADEEGDDEWKAERIVAARAGIEAYRAALQAVPAPSGEVVAWDWPASISIDPERCGGRPVIEGTRFTVAQLLAELAETTGPVSISDNFDMDVAKIWKVLDDLSLLLDRALTTPPVPEGAGEPGSQEHAKTIVRDARALLDRLVMHSPSHGVDEFLDAIQDARLLIARIDGAE